MQDPRPAMGESGPTLRGWGQRCGQRVGSWLRWRASGHPGEFAGVREDFISLGMALTLGGRGEQRRGPGAQCRLQASGWLPPLDGGWWRPTWATILHEPEAPALPAFPVVG